MKIMKMTQAMKLLFEAHCECRPTNTARISHSHDCDTAYTDDVRTVLHGFVCEHDEPVAASESMIAAARQRLLDVLNEVPEAPRPRPRGKK